MFGFKGILRGDPENPERGAEEIVASAQEPPSASTAMKNLLSWKLLYSNSRRIYDQKLRL